MKLGKKILAAVMTLALCLTILAPMPAGAADVCFTAINERVLELTNDTMPVWSDGVLYAPYTTFDAAANGVNWDIECIYTKGSNVVTVLEMDQRKFLEFDLKDSSCRDGLTGEEFDQGAILRSGQPYLPVKTVCDYFGLNYSYREISQGNLLRIKNGDVVLADRTFVEAADNVLNLRLQEYERNEGESDTTNIIIPTRPSQNEDDDELSVATYLSVLCDDAEILPSLLNSLEGRHVQAMFFVTPALAEQRGDLILWILGAGHSVGLLAQGESLEQTRQLLSEGSRALEEQAFLRTTVAYTGGEYREELEQEGWICWNSTLDLSPGDNDGPSYFARRTVNRLAGRTSATYLSLDVNANTLRVLPTLLSQLEEAGYDLALPLETRL